MISVVLATVLPATATEILLFQARWEGNSEIYKLNTDESDDPIRLTNNPADDREPRISPDGSKVAFVSNRTGSYQLFVLDLDDLSVRQITTAGIGGGQQEGATAWSPDGTQLLYGYGRSLMIINTDGTNPHQIALAPIGRGVRYPEWSPAGNKLAFIAESPTWGYTADYYILNPDGTGLQVIVANRPGREYGAPRFSPDGSRLAYAWDPSGHEETWGRLVDSRIYILDLASMTTTEVSTNKPPNSNDMMASWSPDGSRILVNNWASVPGDQAPRNIHLMDANGGNRSQILANCWGASLGEVGPAREFFDDFTYESRDQLAGGTWRITRNETRGDGLYGSRFSHANINFEEDLTNPENMFLTVKTKIQGPLIGRNSATAGEIMTVGDWFRDGTYVARIRFDNGNFGDPRRCFPDLTIQSFYTIKRLECQPEYSECDFEFYPWDSWDDNGDPTPSMHYTTYAEFCIDNEGIRRDNWSDDIDDPDGRLLDWSLLKLTVMGGQVTYEIDNIPWCVPPHVVSESGASVYPDTLMHMALANWTFHRAFSNGPNPHRETTMKVDWVYHCKDRTMTMAQVEARVAELRALGCPRCNTLTEPGISCPSQSNSGVTRCTSTGNETDRNTLGQAAEELVEHLKIGGNPFNPTTSIVYDIPAAAHVSLRVFDMLGREVSILVDGFSEAGVHIVQFDGSRLASGVYFARLDAGLISQTKKMMLLK